MAKELDGSGTPARVLLVRDDTRTATMITEVLGAACTGGLMVTQPTAVAEATLELAAHGATCVLLDASTGAHPSAALTTLAAAAPEIPIIVLSDDPAEELGIAAIRAGAQDHLCKAELTAAGLRRAIRYAIERKRGEVALARQALHDPLTRLPNRVLFVDRLRGALDRSRRTGDPVVVMFLDVDCFKQINDTLGHAAGDRLLIVLAERFGQLLRPMDTVARFGGDEFTFLFEGLGGRRAAAQVAARITASASRPALLAGRRRAVTVSTGVAIVTDPEAATEAVICRADRAMYRAKELGGARFELSGGGIAVTVVDKR